MNKTKSFLLTICLIVSSIFFMAATAPSSNPTPKAQFTAEEVQNAINNNQLGKLVEKATGEKLSLKEKIAMKVFGKKIKNISKTTDANAPKGDKSQTIAFVLCWLLGGLGIHRFYLGYTWQGVVQLLTLGGCGIWVLIDWIRIAIGDLKPKGGSYNPSWGN
jgi:TM2 domain-containing membrane protein YozV